MTPPTQPPSASRRSGADDGPVPVLAIKAERRDMPIDIDSIGTVQAFNTVTVRSEVDGRLIELSFRDGQDVKAGDILAKIDPTIYQAQYDQTLAKKAQDEAILANAQRDLERYLNLAKTEYAPQQQADTQRSTVAQISAQLAADQAAIDNAKAYLERTTIRAPIDGRTGIRLVDKGNLVHASDQTGLVGIAQVMPISVIITLPQQHLPAINRALVRGKVLVDARDGELGTVIDHGTVEVVDNLVDQTTGTIKLKAAFPNTGLALWPGQFVNITLHVGILKDAMMVPTTAVQRGPSGAFVYVVDEQSKVAVRAVTTARQTESDTAIANGLEA
ncbi:MAG: efflux RND transporter periplasmic adaptor subunit, partial [Alphaproteobacteria bacterium]|nr:efflux RND transporter periplasmic adaptor subunit [Alphaproteobacteria bacterium]